MPVVASRRAKLATEPSCTSAAAADLKTHYLTPLRAVANLTLQNIKKKHVTKLQKLTLMGIVKLIV